MEPTQCSETSAFNTQTPGNYPEDNLSSSKLLNLTAKNGGFDFIRDLMKSGANVEVNKKSYLDAFRHSSRERTFVVSVTVVESSRQLRQLDFTYNSSLAMYWCSIGC